MGAFNTWSGPSKWEEAVRESCTCSRNALKSSASAAYLYPHGFSVFSGKQDADKEDKKGELRRDSPETQQFVSFSRWKITLQKLILVALLTLKAVLLPTAF